MLRPDTNGCLGLAVRAAALAVMACTLAALAILTLAQASLPGLPAGPQPGFDACELPCWAGVTPGETAFAQVPARANAHLSNYEVVYRTTGDRLWFEVGTGPLLTGAFYDDRGQVGSMRLETGFPLWKLVETLGTPRCALVGQLSGGRLSLAVYWDAPQETQIAGLAVLTSASAWHPGAPTRTLLVFSGGDYCREVGAIPWTGFAPLWRYSQR